MFLHNKNTQYTYRILLLVWLIISIHVWYRYISFSSEAEQGKWWTFVEASTNKINYLPYVTNNDADKFYQSFLFNGCVYPSFSWTTINYREELCSVDTTDYKTFTVKAFENKYWSDGTGMSLNDIYFTYNTLLKNNYRNIGALDGYSNISIIADEENETLQVIFPKASVDNMIFFTNFILPSHLLANQDLETYVRAFYSNPVWTNCGMLAETKNDSDSIVFDLSKCGDVPLKFYQVKQFEDQSSLDTYISSKDNTIDMIISDQPYNWYETNKVILNTFDTIFFNTQSTILDTQTRKILWSTIIDYFDTTNILEPYLISDHYLFDAFLEDIQKSQLISLLDGNSAIEKEIEVIPELPQIVRWNSNNTTPQEYLVSETIDDKETIKLIFNTAYDRISVSFNDGVEYFPESYVPEEKSSYYNFNPTYRNIIQGRNVYTIKWYEEGIHTSTFTLIVHYLSPPTTPQEELVISGTEDFQPVSIIYYNEKTSNAIADALKTMFKQHDLQNYFVFRRYDDPDVFAGKIQSKDYDMVISSISMWLRKDISNLFSTDNPTINPSLYTDSDLVLALNEWFLFAPEARWDIKQRIDDIYAQTMPFIILWKELWSIHIEETLSFTYPLRMYVLWWRKDFIKDLPIFQHFRIDWDRIREKDNFKLFLSTGGRTEN